MKDKILKIAQGLDSLFSKLPTVKHYAVIIWMFIIVCCVSLPFILLGSFIGFVITAGVTAFIFKFWESANEKKLIQERKYRKPYPKSFLFYKEDGEWNMLNMNERFDKSYYENIIKPLNLEEERGEGAKH